MKKLIILYFLIFSNIVLGSEEPIDTSPGIDPNKPIYVLLVNAQESCNKNTIPVECEIILIYAKHEKVLLLGKVNKKSSQLPGNQVDVNKIMNNIDAYRSFATEYELSSLFNGNENFTTLSARIMFLNGNKNIELKATQGTNNYIAHIDISNYTN